MLRSIILLVVAGIATGTAPAQTLKRLHAEGKKIVTPDKQEVILRGVNLGQWLVMEGFMSGSNGNMAQVDMKRKLYDAGQTPAQIEGLFEQWRANFITRADIDFVASRGFNCIRVPLHYELFLTRGQRELRTEVAYADGTAKLTKYNAYKTALKNWADNNELAMVDSIDGFQLIDTLISWCKPYGIYLVLDMHVVPGTAGTNTPITDQLYAGKDFFTDSKNRTPLYRIWDKISERYKEETTIAMYDLINEPHSLSEGDMGILKFSYNQMITDIRANGDSTLIVVQGTEYGNQYKRNGGINSLFPTDFSSRYNLVYSIHRYRLPNNTTESNPWNLQNHVAYFADAIAFQNTHNVPYLVGETGLDTDYTRLAGNFDLMDDLKMGSTLWSLKYHTDGGVNRAPMDIPGVNPWDNLTQWTNGTLFNNIRFENCIRNPVSAYWEAILPRYPLVSGGTYKVLNYLSGKALEVAAPATNDGDNVQQGNYTYTPDQHWVLSLSDAWSFMNANSGLALEIADSATSNEANAQQGAPTQSDFQKWLLEWKNGHAYSLTNKGSNLYLEVAGSSMDDGANVLQNISVFSNNRKWVIVPILDQSIGLSTALTSPLPPTIRVYPTRVEALLQVEGLSPASSLKLYDVSGRLIRSIGQQNQEQVHMDLSGLAPGMYLLEIRNQNEVYQTKIVKL